MNKGIKRALRRVAFSITAGALGAAAFAPGAQAAHFVNLATIGIPGGGHAGPYPSTIAVTGLSGKVSKVTPAISGMQDEFDDVQILLVGPGGQTTLLWRAVCQNALNFSGQTYVFDDAGTPLPQNNCPGSGIYKPTDLDNSPVPFTPPAPQGQPYGTALSSFNGTAPNGTWSLFIESTQAGGSGNLVAGWSLDVETVPDAVPAKKKCKKKKHRSAESAKKKKCKKKKHG